MFIKVYEQSSSNTYKCVGDINVNCIKYVDTEHPIKSAGNKTYYLIESTTYVMDSVELYIKEDDYNSARYDTDWLTNSLQEALYDIIISCHRQVLRH